MLGSFEAYGPIRCRFGGQLGEVGTYISSSSITCNKPRFPDTLRDQTGRYDLDYSPNGQCFHTMESAALAPNASRSGFYTYNALFDSISQQGAPSTTAISLEVFGSGFTFPPLPGGLCAFVSPTSTEVRPLALTSATHGTCQTPAAGIHGARYTVQLMTNGVTKEPTRVPTGSSTRSAIATGSCPPI